MAARNHRLERIGMRRRLRALRQLSRMLFLRRIGGDQRLLDRAVRRT